MSRRALLYAVRDTIRTKLGYTAQQCERMADGRPPAAAGQVFVAVHAGGRRNSSKLSLDERYDLVVTLTMRVGAIPEDRWGTELMDKPKVGFDDRADAIRALIHRDCLDYSVTILANQYLGETGNDTAPHGFREPLAFVSDDKATIVGASWFHAGKGRTKNDESAITQNLYFGRARRLQPLDTMT